MKEEEKKREEAPEIQEPEPKREEPDMESEKPSQEMKKSESKTTEEFNGVGKGELPEKTQSLTLFSAMAAKRAEENMARVRQVINEPTLAITRHIAETARQQREMIASVTDNMKLIRGAPESDSAKFNQVSRAVESMRFIKTDSLKHVLDMGNHLAESLRAVQPDWKPILSAMKQGMTVMRDSQIEEYEASPYFQENIKTTSKELITLPFAPSGQVLELLSLEDFDLNQLKEMLGVFDVELLGKEVANPEHEGYKFKEYIEEALANHKEQPDRYRLLIPAFLLVIEGTLSEIFKISERGTAREIKQKMNLFWDLFQASYVQRSFDKTEAFYTQVLLSNVKKVFEELTSSSNNHEGVKINRNLILHGRSNPDDWLEEDFFTLSQLLNTALYIKRTLNIMLDDFMELTNGNDSSIFFIEYKSILMNVIARLPKEDKARLTLASTEAKLLSILKIDLKDIFGSNGELIDEIIHKCPVTDVAKEAYKSYYNRSTLPKGKKKNKKR